MIDYRLQLRPGSTIKKAAQASNGAISAGRINHQTSCCPKCGYMYVRIPKAASQTATATLALHDPHFQRVQARASSQGKSSDYIAFREEFSTALQAGIFNDQQFRATRILTIVRNPYTRFLSAALSKGRSVGAGELGKDSIPELRWKLEVILVQLLDSPKRVNKHFLPQAFFLPVPSSEFTFVGKFERLPGDLSRLVSIAQGTKLTKSELFSASSHQTGADKKLDSVMTSSMRKKIEEFYKVDFEQFGY